MSAAPIDPARALGLRPASPQPAPCKVCGGASPLFGVVDFARICDEPRAKVQPLTGAAVYYRRCQVCGLIFSDAFDDWSHADFAAHVYNDVYLEIDPDYVELRPNNQAQVIAATFGASMGEIDVLDYGGGTGKLAAGLRERGFRSAASYDAFSPEFRERPQRRFNLVTCFETLEHMPDPVGGASDIVSLMEDDGLLLFSTLVQPANIAEIGLRWGYVGPRNGHITLHTRQSLARLFDRFGLKTASFDDNIHVAFRTLPPWARHLMAS
ncbi:MAG: class I SAM-dependent methyltransferase [Proteobacteria bacterium]|nr:class I SAM-dependent methyltransferase [Pseudomonadota bacterium]